MAQRDASSTGVLSDDQLAALLRRAGVPAGDAAYLVATAHPESGADAAAVQKDQPYATTGWGLWQITPGNSEPKFGVNNALLNPQKNADAAAAKLKSQGLGAWTTITDGLYKPYFATAEEAVARVYKMSGSEVAKLAASAGTGGGSTGGGGGGGGGSSNAPSWLSELWSSLGVGAKADPGSPLLPGAGFLGQTNPISATEAGLLAIAAPLVKVGQAIDWFIQPNHWVRIFCGIGGSILAVAGVWNLSHVGGQASSITVQGTSLPTSAGGTIALPIGILEVGIGGVLLFVAFHNLPATVETFPDFLSYLQQEIQSAPSKAPAA